MAFFSNLPSRGDDLVRGNDTNEALIGYTGNDTLLGGGGGDVFWQGWYMWDRGSAYDDPNIGPFTRFHDYDFGQGNDVINGGSGFDWIVYADRYLRGTQNVLDLTARTITKLEWTDRFSGIEAFKLSYGNDAVVGRQAGVVLDLGGGNDTLSGTSGFLAAEGGNQLGDLVDYGLWKGNLDVDLARDAGGGGSVLSGFNWVIGARAYANVLRGDDDRNRLTGGDRGDHLSGADGNDELVGGSGQDSLFGDAGRDRLTSAGPISQLMGGAGHDTLEATGNSSSLFGGIGQDHLIAEDGNNRLDGGDGDDRLSSGRGGDFLHGGDGADVLSSEGGDDRVVGFTGDDRLYAGDGNDMLDGGEGLDSLYGGAGDDLAYISYDRLIDTGDGNDRVLALAQSATGFWWRFVTNLFLGDGDDIARLGPGTVNTLFAGNGDDALVLWGATPHSTESGTTIGMVSLGAGNDTVTCHFGSVTGGAGNDTIRLTTPSDDIYYVADSNEGTFIWGGAGDDTVWIGARTSYSQQAWVRAYGGSGRDTITLGAGRYIDEGGLTAEELAAIDDISQVSEYHRISSFEVVNFSSPRVQVVYARSDAHSNFGDTDDLLNIAAADRSYDMGGGADRVVIAANNVTVEGGGGRDVIETQKGYNTIYGGEGDDQISGYARGLSLYGGDGNDVVGVGSSGSHRVNTGSGDDYLSAHGAGSYYTSVGDDVLRIGRYHYEMYEDPDVWQLDTQSSLEAVVASGTGNDLVLISEAPKSVNLGDGDDVILINTRANEYWDMTTGDGFDLLSFVTTYQTVMKVRVLDFDVQFDRLSVVTGDYYRRFVSFAELDSVSQFSWGTRLREGGITIDLYGVDSSEVAAVISLTPEFFG